MVLLDNIKAVLNKGQQRKAVYLGALVLVAMFLEMASIAIIGPFLSVVIDSNALNNYEIIRSAMVSMEVYDHGDIIILISFFILLINLVKSMFMVHKSRFQARYIYSVQQHLSSKLFKYFIHKPYHFHLNNDSSKLTHITIEEVQGFIIFLVQSVIVVTEIFVSLGLFVLMVYVSYEASLAMIVIFLLSAISVYFYYKNKINLLGKERQYQEGECRKHIRHGYEGVKTIMFMNLHDYFLKRYVVSIEKLVDSLREYQISLEVPKIWLELIMIVAFMSVTIVLYMQDHSYDHILPVMGIFAAIAFRVLPSVTRILAGVQMMRFYYPSLNVIRRELAGSLEVSKKYKSRCFKFEKYIQIENLFFSYDGNTKVLDGLNVSIKRGDFIGIIGESGEGKSTLVDIVLGLIVPDSGSVSVDGVDVFSDLNCWRREVGYIPQDIFFTNSSIKSNIAFGLNSEQIDEAVVDDVVSASQLDKFISTLENGLETSVGENGSNLSGGQRQRIGIARALYNKPNIIVFDEATSALDEVNEENILNMIKELSGINTIIFITHRKSISKYCDKVYLLENKRLHKV